MVLQHFNGMQHKFIVDNSSNLPFEIILLLLITIFTFLIYYKTKEIFQLTEHKGIKYFRRGFLFYSITSFIAMIELIIEFIQINFNLQNFAFDIKSLFIITMYTQIIGTGYLLFSIYYKKLKYESIIYIFSTSIIFFGLFIKTRGLNMTIFSFILVFLTYISIKKYFISKRNKNKKKVLSQIYLIYSFLFLIWLIIFIGSRISFALDFYIPRELISMVLTITFGYILYIVSKTLNLKNK